MSYFIRTTKTTSIEDPGSFHLWLEELAIQLSGDLDKPEFVGLIYMVSLYLF